MNFWRRPLRFAQADFFASMELEIAPRASAVELRLPISRGDGQGRPPLLVVDDFVAPGPGQEAAAIERSVEPAV